MRLSKTERGFEIIKWPAYIEKNGIHRLVQQSSAIGDGDDAVNRPGSSFLWVGEHHHLDREEVQELIRHLQAWVNTGSLKVAEKRIDNKPHPDACRCITCEFA